MHCILCKSINLKKLDQFKARDINNLYEIGFNIRPIRGNEENEIKYLCCNNCELRFFIPQISGDESFYKKLSQYDWYYIKDKFEFDFALKNINPTDRVLEVGAGEGFFASKLPRSVNYLGLEFNQRAINLAQEKNLNIVRKELSQLDLKNPFDVSLSFQVLEHVENPYLFIKEQVDLLKEGGKLIIAVPSQDSFYRNILNHTLDLPPHHLSRWNSNTLREVAKMFHLKLISVEHEPLHTLHYEFYLTHKVANLFIKNDKVLDLRNFNKIVFKVSRLIAKLIMPFYLNKLTKVKGAHFVALFQK